MESRPELPAGLEEGGELIEKDYRAAAAIFNKTEALYITAGAGIGVDSGLPDFRGTEGFWKAYPPIAKLGISFPEMANPEWFKRDPAFAWAFYGHRLSLYRRTQPHQGFRMLLDFAQQLPGGYFVFTSNVDGQFQKAGYDEDRIKECHGSIHYLQCVQRCTDNIWDASRIEVQVDDSEFKAREPLPHCPNCGGLARPNMLMFNDWDWIQKRTHEQGLRQSHWIDQVLENGHLLTIIEMGAGTAVPTVRYQSERVAGLTDAVLIRVNPQEPQVRGPSHISLPVGSLEAVTRILQEATA